MRVVPGLNGCGFMPLCSSFGVTVNPNISWSDSARRAEFQRWFDSICTRHALLASSLEPASADASFRRYLRVQGQAAGAPCSFIIMDAPPPLEDVRPFQHVASLLHAAQLHAPQVLEADVQQGFLLLTDLGTRLYLHALKEASASEADALMRQALKALVHLQQHVPAAVLPPFDETLLRTELSWFPQWCVQREFGITWSNAETKTWDSICDLLVHSALAQPTVAVHADWMPRNLMVSADAAMPAILDFQDAVRGPITYDMASLLRDAFISWSEEQELDWAVRGWQAARQAGLPVDADFGEYWRQLEWMGLQRHLKVLGVFCRLKHRDGKAAYAQDLPRFFAYATRVALRYGPLKPLLKLLAPMSGTPVDKGFTF
jgi:N-acetylmuramate 1-kinase